MDALKNSILSQVANECIGCEIHDMRDFRIVIDKEHADAYESLKNKDGDDHTTIKNWLVDGYSKFIETLDTTYDCEYINIEFDDYVDNSDDDDDMYIELSFSMDIEWAESEYEDDE